MARQFYSNSRSSFRSRRPSAPKSRNQKQYINPSRFIQAAKEVKEEVYIPTNQFVDFDLNDLLQTNIKAKGYVSPSPIQDKAIPVGLDGKDIVGIANTGTGKTAAFALPILHQLMLYPQAKAIVIAPTRELAQQIEDECRAFAKNSGLRAALLIGGMPMPAQFRELNADPSIVIGTPGRIKDHVQRGSLDLSKFTLVALDEVDRMVDMGFIKDVRFLLSQISDTRQSFFFSATLDPNLKALIESFLREPVTISVKTGETSANVEQNVVHYTDAAHKIEQLHDALNHENTKKALIFDDTKRSVDRLAKMLQERGFKSDSIHGGKSQAQRQRALDKFKRNDINILVATDVAARGIDVADVTHVINYSTPQTYEDYVHRIGRAGRAGRTGYALTFIDRR